MPPEAPVISAVRPNPAFLSAMMLLTFRGISLAKCLAVARDSPTLAPQQQPKHQHVRDQEKRHQHGWNEKGGAHEARRLADGRRVALVERVKQIDTAAEIERPGQDEPQSAR